MGEYVPKGSASHFLLGLKIVLSAGLFGFTLLGFKRAGDALEDVLDGIKWRWLWVCWWLGCAAGWFPGSSPTG